jgi:hypothetical protein
VEETNENAFAMILRDGSLTGELLRLIARKNPEILDQVDRNGRTLLQQDIEGSVENVRKVRPR